METTDVFGRALWDWARGGTDVELLERDDGFTQLGAGAEVYLAPRREWPRAEQESLHFVHGRTLDVGCGAGRTSLELERRGMEVVGLDASPLAVKAARSRGVTTVWKGSVFDLGARLGHFDTVILFGNNVGIFASPATLRSTLRTWSRRTRPSTRLLLESTHPFYGGAPGLDRRYYLRNQSLGRPPGRGRFRYHYQHHVGGWFTWLYLSERDLARVLPGTGWRVAHWLKDSLDEPYVAVLVHE